MPSRFSIEVMIIRRRDFLLSLLIGCLGIWLFLLWQERLYREQESRAATAVVTGRIHYSLIEEGLYLGGAVAEPPPGTRAVLNLCEKADPYQCDVQLWEPIPDREPAPSIDWLRRMVKFIDTQRRAGHPIFVHCHYGQSRSAMVVSAYLMSRNKWTRDETLAFLRARRPIAQPNDAFLERLLEWECAIMEE